MGQEGEPADARGEVAVPPELREAIDEALAAGERVAARREPAALDALVAAWEAIIRAERFDLAPPDFRAAVFNSRGHALEQRYGAMGASADLNGAIEAFEGAFEAAPASSGSRPGYLSNLGTALGYRYARSGAVQDLDTAIVAFEEAVETTPSESPDRPMYLGNLGNGLKARFERSGAPADLEASMMAFRQALETAPPDDPNRPALLSNLGGALRARYNRNGAPADLDAAIAAQKEALDATSVGAPDRPAILGNLGSSLGERYSRSGAPGDLDEAIAAHQEALVAIPPDAPSRPAILGNVGTGLRARYARAGAMADLDNGIRASQEALDSTPADSPDRPGYLRNFGTGLRERYGRTRVPADLESAITAHREAVEATPADSPDRPGTLVDLGIDLSERYRRSDAAADLEEAVAAYRAALEALPRDAPNRPIYLNNLGTGLRTWYGRSKAPADLSAAIGAFEEALEGTPPDAPSRPGYLGNLGDGLRDRHAHTGAPTDLDAATDAYRQSSRLGLTIAPAVTLAGSQIWGAWASGRGAWPEAAEAYGYGLAAIDQLYQTQLLPGAKQNWLGDAQGLAAAAAYALARTGDLAGAGLALERGRARLLTEAIERDRADLAEVATLDPAAHGAYELAAEQLRALERLERAAGSSHEDEASLSVPADDLQERARRARADLEAAVSRIQQLPGHATFGQPPTFDEVAAVAEPAWPLVALVTTAAGSLALLVARADAATEPTFEVIWAPELTSQVLGDLLTTVENSQVVGGYLVGQLGDQDALEAALADGLPKVGASLIGPVATRLRELNASGVVLLPTGLLGLLPLHAAPYPVDGETRCLLDEFDVSHTPGARVLGAARAALAARESQPAVLVGVGNPQPHPQPLAFARAELEEVARFFPDGASHPLYETAATETALVGLLPQATHVHLACHGRFDADNPLDSCLELARPDPPLPDDDEGRVRLEEILANDWFGHSRLVVLSACQTAITDARRLPDEAIGLPAGLLQAGVPGVIGTLWSVDDLSTTLLMTQFYAYHRQGDPLTGEGPLPPAAALRRAQGWLKTRTADDLVALLAAHRSMAAAAEQRHGTRMSAAEAGAGLRQLGLEDPTSRPYAALYHWAPFVAIGA